MTSSLLLIALLAIMQTDHLDKITSEESVSQSAYNGKRCNPTSCLHDLLRFFPLTPFRHCQWRIKFLELVPWSKSTVLPDGWLFWLCFYEHLLLDYWLLSGEEPNLNLVTWIFICAYGCIHIDICPDLGHQDLSFPKTVKSSGDRTIYQYVR